MPQSSPARLRGRSLRHALTAFVAVALVAVVLPAVASPADARPTARHAARAHPKAHAGKAHHARHVVRRAPHRVLGRPGRSYVMPSGAYFSFPNRTEAEAHAIRDRVLLTVRSVWGGPRNSLGTPMPTNGTIRMATWSFDDWAMAKALVAAKRRGVSVQVMAASSRNAEHPAWTWLREKLGGTLFRRGHPVTRTMYSFARQCRGACRGPGGTAHAKYFLFDNVGRYHAKRVVVQTSMNLTKMAYTGQWNQAQVVHSPVVFNDFLRVFRQASTGRTQAQPYHVSATGNVVDFFFPRPQATAPQDPVMQILNRVNCSGATGGGTGPRTKVRVIQYAVYGDRGLWIAKKLRYLWNRGCDVAIIYSVSSRPVLSVLRNRSGRGAIPMRQSVVKDYWGNIVQYNHSKWMTVTGHWGRSTAAYLTFTGSANWANLAFGDDEQMQRISARSDALRYLATFTKTWHQESSRPPSSAGHVSAFGRTAGRLTLDEPAVAPEFGKGVFRYMTED